MLPQIDGAEAPAPPEQRTQTRASTTEPAGAPAAPRRPSVRPEWRRAMATGISVWGCAALANLLINCLTWTVGTGAPAASRLFEVWNRWDTRHYLTIATTGYDATTENTAFFPLYPMLMRVLDPVLPGNMLATALIISNVSCIAALILLHRLTEDLLGEAIARRTVFYLIAFPFGFFLLAPYNESTFLALALGSLYAMRRGRWLAAGLLGAFAGATRQAGLLLVLAFAVEYLRQRRSRPAAIAVALIPTGALAYAGYCWAAFGDPLKFVHVQAAWGRAPALPWVGIGRAIASASTAAAKGSPFQYQVVLNVLDVVVVLLAVVLLLWSSVGLWRLGNESLFLVVFAWADLLLVMTSPLGLNLPVHGAPRYVLELAPVFILLARVGASPRVERFYLFPAIGLQGVLTLLWFQGAWLS